MFPDYLFYYFCKMEQKLNELLEGISQLFIKYGIKSVTMDDIARHLGISKKTLYQYFADKRDLVEKIVLFHINKHNSEFKEKEFEKLNAIDILLTVSKNVMALLEEFTPSICYDLQKYYPEIHKIFSDHKNKHIFENVKMNIIKGMAEGLYRKDIDPDIISTIYVSRIEMIFNYETFPSDKFSLMQVFDEAFRYHIHGIASKKGIEYYESKIKS